MSHSFHGKDVSQTPVCSRILGPVDIELPKMSKDQLRAMCAYICHRWAGAVLNFANEGGLELPLLEGQLAHVREEERKETKGETYAKNYADIRFQQHYETDVYYLHQYDHVRYLYQFQHDALQQLVKDFCKQENISC